MSEKTKKVISLESLAKFCSKYVFDSTKQSKVSLTAEDINKIYKEIKRK